MSPGARTLSRLCAGAGLAAVPLVVAVGLSGDVREGPRAPFRDGPPAGVTGGFGQDSCHACHFDRELNDGGAELAIEGLPARYAPGETYPLEVVLTRSGMGVGGFQLSARDSEEGSQAGTLAAGPADEGRVAVVGDREIQYIQHVLEGITLTAPDTARWRILWTAPDAGLPVTFNVAAVAGNDDGSQFEDRVHTAAVRVKPEDG